MPYHIQSSDGKYEVVDDAGKVAGTHPTRKQAIAQLQALYANVPEARKEASDMDAETEKASSEPGDYLIVEDREKPTTFHLQVRKNGKPDHGLMGGAWAALHEGYRGNKYEGPGKQEAIGKLRKMYEAENMPIPGEKEVKGNPLERVIAMIKGDQPGHPFRGNQYGSEGSSGGGGGGSDNDGESSSDSSDSTPSFNDVLARGQSKYPNDKKAMALQRKLQPHEVPLDLEIRGAWGLGTAEGRYRNHRITVENALRDKKNVPPEVLADYPDLAKRYGMKEGRRNSATDNERLQQIHDLSVENGAACPLTVTKDAKTGAARWVLISTNAYEDRDGEYVSRKAQKRDVERMNEAKAYGPLRLWHLGYPDVEKKEAGPGVDIGDCDYSQMFGKFRVESGTFRNERVAAAIKERSDRWSTSLGFFHPPDEPDQSGTYHEIYTFERSLLPRTKASNYLTPLAAILKENDMTTKEDKVKGLTDLLGDEKLAQDVLGQVDKMEKDAQARGLSYKQADDKPAVPAEKSGDKKDDADEDDMAGMDEATAKAYKAMLPHIVKTIHALTKGANIEEAAAREAKSAKKEKKARKALEAQVKELEARLKELNGELPRGLAQGAYRPTQTGANLITLDGSPMFKENVPDPLGDFMANMGMAKIDPAQLSGNGNGR